MSSPSPHILAPHQCVLKGSVHDERCLWVSPSDMYNLYQTSRRYSTLAELRHLNRPLIRCACMHTEVKARLHFKWLSRHLRLCVESATASEDRMEISVTYQQCMTVDTSTASHLRPVNKDMSCARVVLRRPGVVEHYSRTLRTEITASNVM